MTDRAYTYFNVTIPRKGIAQVEINRPDKLNAFLEEMRFELRTIFDGLSTDPLIKVVLLSGAHDKAFSVGLDVKAAVAEGSVLNPRAEDIIDGARRATVLRRWLLDFQDCVSSVERCEKPVICIMHGYSIGAAIDIATCADIRICSSDSKFCVKEVDIGLAADVGTLSRLPKIVGSYGWVKEVCLTARYFDATEALDVGFVKSVHPTKHDAVQEGLRIATLISQKSLLAGQGIKNSLDWSRDHSIGDALQYSAVRNSGDMQTKDVQPALDTVPITQGPGFSKL